MRLWISPTAHKGQGLFQLEKKRMQTHMHMSKYLYQYQNHLPNTELFTLLIFNTLTRFYDGQVYT